MAELCPVQTAIWAYGWRRRFHLGCSGMTIRSAYHIRPPSSEHKHDLQWLLGPLHLLRNRLWRSFHVDIWICAHYTPICRMYGLTAVIVRLGGCKVKGMVAWVMGLMYIAVFGVVGSVYPIVRHSRIFYQPFFGRFWKMKMIKRAFVEIALLISSIERRILREVHSYRLLRLQKL